METDRNHRVNTNTKGKLSLYNYTTILVKLIYVLNSSAKQTFVDDSDRTLIRVARSDLDEDEPKHKKHVKKLHHHKTAAVEGKE